jgi:hypothetical protein
VIKTIDSNHGLSKFFELLLNITHSILLLNSNSLFPSNKLSLVSAQVMSNQPKIVFVALLNGLKIFKPYRSLVIERLLLRKFMIMIGS